MKTLLSFLLSLFFFSCQNTLEITVSNPSPFDRENEIVEISYDEIVNKLKGDRYVLYNSEGEIITTQKVYDGKVVFPVSVKAGGVASFTMKTDTKTQELPEYLVYGKQYPERLDDIAWENDRIAFRAYGPALQARGEKSFGYDVLVKRVPQLVIEERYRGELSKEKSYHVDHGNGMDYYAVGPTLGAGTSALFHNDSIVYPYCYKDYEILDNGPLRFTVKLVFNPLKIGENDNVIETRVISLDAGSQLNKIDVFYDNLTTKELFVAGIVLHEPSREYDIDMINSYIAYAEPKDPENGQTFIGVVFPESLKEAKVIDFSTESNNNKYRAGAPTGHLLAFAEYEPEQIITYYAGAGWSKWGFESSDVWFNYMETFSKRLSEPLVVTLK